MNKRKKKTVYWDCVSEDEKNVFVRSEGEREGEREWERLIVL